MKAAAASGRHHGADLGASSFGVRVRAPDARSCRLADDPLASNQTECEHIVDAVTRLTAGVRPTVLRIHDLRHAAASRLIDAGLDPVTVASVALPPHREIILSSAPVPDGRLATDAAAWLRTA